MKKNGVDGKLACWRELKICNQRFLFVLLIIFILLLNLSFISAQTHTLKVTEEHPFFLDGKWIAANELKVGDMLFTDDGKKAKITAIKEIDDSVEVYNLEAKPFNDFIVSGNVVVHNSGTQEVIFEYRILNPDVPVIDFNSVDAMTPSERISYAERALKRTFTQQQRDGIVQLHNDKTLTNGQKFRRLVEMGFSPEEAADLLTRKICGQSESYLSNADLNRINLEYFEENGVIERYLRGDPYVSREQYLDAVEHLAELNKGLIYLLLRKTNLRNYLEIYADTIGESELVLEAMNYFKYIAERFDPTSGNEFSTYAVHALRNFMSRYIANKLLPEGARTPLNLAILFEIRKIHCEEGSFNEAVILEKLKQKFSDVGEIVLRKLLRIYPNSEVARRTSLDAVTDDSGRLIPFRDTQAVEPCRNACGREILDLFNEIYPTDLLNAREKMIFEMQLKGMTYKEIGEKLCLTKQRIEQILSILRDKLKFRMEYWSEVKNGKLLERVGLSLEQKQVLILYAGINTVYARQVVSSFYPRILIENIRVKPHTFAEIAKKMKLSEERVRNLFNSLLRDTHGRPNGPVREYIIQQEGTF